MLPSTGEPGLKLPVVSRRHGRENHWGVTGLGGSAYERLAGATADLAILLGRLEAVIAHREQRGYRDEHVTGRGGTRPLAAWNTGAAMIILDVHAGARKLETNLRYEIAGVHRVRGGSDANTGACLDAILGLCGGADDHLVRDATRRIERWCWQARLALGEREPWLQLPRMPGQQPARCPWCAHHTLRHKPVTGVVRCVNPECRDEAGRRPFGRVQIGTFSGEPGLVWQDDSAGLALPGSRP